MVYFENLITTVYSSFSLVENRDLLEDRRTADAMSVTSQSQPFPNYQAFLGSDPGLDTNLL